MKESTQFMVRFHLILSRREAERADNSGKLLLDQFPESECLIVDPEMAAEELTKSSL